MASRCGERRQQLALACVGAEMEKRRYVSQVETTGCTRGWITHRESGGREDSIRGPDVSLWVGGDAIGGDGETTGRMGLRVEVSVCLGIAEYTAAQPAVYSSPTGTVRESGAHRSACWLGVR